MFLNNWEYLKRSSTGETHNEGFVNVHMVWVSGYRNIPPLLN